MGKMKHTVVSSCFGVTLSVIITGCMGHASPLKPNAHVGIPSTSSLSSKPTQARPVVIGDKRHVLNTTPSGEDITLGDDENMPDEDSDNAVEDPTAEDEGAVGEAVLNAAQHLLDENTLNASNNIWPRVRAGFSLPDRDHPNVQPSREWFANHQAYLDRNVALSDVAAFLDR